MDSIALVFRARHGALVGGSAGRAEQSLKLVLDELFGERCTGAAVGAVMDALFGEW